MRSRIAKRIFKAAARRNLKLYLPAKPGAKAVKRKIIELELELEME